MTIRDSVADLASSLELPEEALASEVKITLLGRRRAVLEHHAGLLGYTGELVEVGAGRGRVRLVGSALTLRAMDGDALLVTGQISAVEYA